MVMGKNFKCIKIMKNSDVNKEAILLALKALFSLPPPQKLENAPVQRKIF